MKDKRFALLHSLSGHNVFIGAVVSVLLLGCSSIRAQNSGMPPPVTGLRALEAATRLDYLFDGQTAIRLLPSEMVIGQGVTQAEWSPDGRFVIAVRVAPVIEPTLAVPVSVAIWDKTKQRSIELWSRRLAMPMLTGPVQWAANASVGLLRWRWMESDENGNWGIKEGIVLVNAAQGVAREVDMQPSDGIFLSPTLAGGVILRGNLRIALQSLSVLALDGSVTPPVPLPEGTLSCHQMRWQADGKQFYMELSLATAQDKKDGVKREEQGVGEPSHKQWVAVDMTHPGVVLLDKEPDLRLG